MALDAHTSQQSLSQRQSNDSKDISFFRDVKDLTIHGGPFTLNALIETGPNKYLSCNGTLLINPTPDSPRPSSQQHDNARKLCPLPVASFTGRAKILERMHKYFGSDAECQRIFVLYGLGGSGKSQLAFKFLQQCQSNKRYSEFMIMIFILVYDFGIAAFRTSSTLTPPMNKHWKWTSRVSRPG